MGVTILQQFSILENKTGPQTIELLTKRVVALGAVPTGQFLVDCETYMSVPQLGAQKTVHVLHNSEQPASVFSILESGNKTIPLVADGLFDLLMMKMTSIYTSKKQTKIESKGPRFELGDFCIKLGNVTMSQNFKGILIEVEYRPCVIPASAWDLMREFLQGFLGSSVPSTPPPYFQSRMNDIYQPIDTIQQYLEQFGAYRKATGIRN
ncbi:mediator of RNA polymerase II transcription subunit 20 [Ctenocephalides felis]|uniref:mediator of RNA polymerase II transcription subunit 20 n=1 Tax=Ctenocephalides felis TaxID=7515 RepID=UPI000E6E351E|nr:mediator of RNA polymerase II transcription subunit 20 [Ctenocephalides felis]